MRIIYVDDEKNALINFEYAIKGIEDIKTYKGFQSAKEALDYARDNYVNVAFLDVEIGDTRGTQLAGELKKIYPNIVVIYITGHSEYALDAYRTGGRAYLLKPYIIEEVERVFGFLKLIFGNKNPEEKKIENSSIYDHRIFIKTFGNFDLFIEGKPVIFKNAKSKELLALLVDKQGSTLNNLEIFNYLWEDSEYNKVTATYVRKTLKALKDILDEYDCKELVSFNRNATYFNKALYNSGFFTCDYYSVFNSDTHYVNDYSGHYMAQYQWSEETIYILENKIKELIN